MKKLQVQGVHHITIVGSTKQSAVDFWQGVLGMPFLFEQPNLGKLHATRRVARTIYLGSAPTAAAAHRGLEDRRVKLGCVMPGESPAVFGDALRRLAAAATYLYQDGPRFWYATQPTVTKLAEDRAEQYK